MWTIRDIRAPDMTVGHYVLLGAGGVDASTPCLDSTLFHVGRRMMVFASREMVGSSGIETNYLRTEQTRGVTVYFEKTPTPSSKRASAAYEYLETGPKGGVVIEYRKTAAAMKRTISACRVKSRFVTSGLDILHVEGPGGSETRVHDSDGHTRLIDAEFLEQFIRNDGDFEIPSAHLSPDGRRVAVELCHYFLGMIVILDVPYRCPGTLLSTQGQR